MLSRSNSQSFASLRRVVEPVVALEARRLLTAAPSLSISSSITVPAGASIQVPIAGSARGGVVTYTVSGGTDAGLATRFHDAANPYLDLTTSLGTLRFQLLADVAPGAVRRISGLVESGFYDGLVFHRIVNVNGLQFAQGGDPKQDGTGGPDFTFDDEFNADTIFSGAGQLATANTSKFGAGKDKNGSAFLITNGPARNLDFNHTIFGQLVRGMSALGSIVDSPTKNYRPTTPIQITAAAIVQDASDAVLQVKAGSKLGKTSIVVVGRDGAGRETRRTVSVNVVPNSSESAPPILAAVKPISAQPGETIVIPIVASNLPNNAYDIGGDYYGDELSYTRVDQLQKQIVVRLADDASGPIDLVVGVKGPDAVSRGDINLPVGANSSLISSGIWDTQHITIAVGDASIDDASATTSTSFVLRSSTELKDAPIATFVAGGSASGDSTDYAATIDWGDGTVSDSARVLEVRSGQFAVYGTHEYDVASALPATLPVTIDITAQNGAGAQVETSVRVAPAVVQVGRTLMLTGTEAADVYTLRLDDDDNLIVSGSSKRWPASGIDRVEAYLGGGNDTFDANQNELPVSLYVDAGAGDDVVRAGPRDDTIDGGDGNDQLGGNGGDDRVNGGAGNDTILGGTGKNALYGDADDDRITGSGGHDFISGGDGNDRLYGHGGDDILDGGAGVDRLYGEDGNDVIIGGSGNDRIYGGNGDDLLYGKAGNDTLNGGPGRNRRGDIDSGDVLIDIT